MSYQLHAFYQHLPYIGVGLPLFVLWKILQVGWKDCGHKEQILRKPPDPTTRVTPNLLIQKSATSCYYVPHTPQRLD